MVCQPLPADRTNVVHVSTPIAAAALSGDEEKDEQEHE
jgi:hypothetical protein